MMKSRQQSKLSSFFPTSTSTSTSKVSSSVIGSRQNGKEKGKFKATISRQSTRKRPYTSESSCRFQEHYQQQQTRIQQPQKYKGDMCFDISLRGSKRSTSRFQRCVICYKSFPQHLLIQHASDCNFNCDDDGIQTDVQIERNNPTNIDHLRYSSIRAVNHLQNNKELEKDRFSLNRHTQSCNDNTPRGVTESSRNAIKNSNKTKLYFSESEETPIDEIMIERQSTSGQESSKLWQSIIKDVKKNEIHNVGEGLGEHEQGLKPTSEPLPGLFLFENFLSEDEERSIIKFLDSPYQSHTTWKHSTFNGKHLGKRWGVHCNLRDRRVYPQETPLPPFVVDLILPKLLKLKCMKGCIPNEANAIDYERKKGHYLKSHVDDRQMSKESIANLSLAGDCYMTFTHVKRHKKKKTSHSGNWKVLPDQYKVLLKRRTLQVLTGCSRYDYAHGIVNNDFLSDRRISLTMRQSPLTVSKLEK